jgi:hypothetical protein
MEEGHYLCRDAADAGFIPLADFGENTLSQNVSEK